MDFLEDWHFMAFWSPKSNRANCSTSIDGLPDGTSNWVFLVPIPIVFAKQALYLPFVQ